jgi:hypothetical protein
MLGEKIKEHDQQSQPGNDGYVKSRPGTEDGRTIMIIVMVMWHGNRSSKSQFKIQNLPAPMLRQTGKSQIVKIKAQKQTSK